MKTELHNFDFCTKMGFEFSILPTYEDSEFVEEDMVRKLLRKNTKNDFPKVYSDCGSIEINSPVFTNSEDTLKFFDKMDAVRDKLGLKFWDENEMSGGLHVHINPIGSTVFSRLAFVRNLYVYITNNPYLNWVFNDPNDDINARCLLSGEGHFNRDKVDALKFLKTLEKKHYVDINALSDLDSKKKYALRYDSYLDTIELRFFDMIKDRNELYHIIKFLDQLLSCFNNDSWLPEIDYNSVKKHKKKTYWTHNK